MTSDEQPSRLPIVTLMLLGVNVSLYVLEGIRGAGWMDRTPEALLAWGASLSSYSLAGQPWRLLTSTFLHVDLMHLALNMWMLAIFGSRVEIRFGHVRFGLVYLVSALAGSLVSALWHAQNLTVSAGASGALMGLCGAYCADWMMRHESDELIPVPDAEESDPIRGPLVQTIVLTLGYGVFNAGVDNAGHVGGLVAGLIVGGAFALVPRHAGRLKEWGGVIGVSCIAFACMYAKLQSGPPAGLAVTPEQMQLAKQLEDADRRSAAVEPGH